MKIDVLLTTLPEQKRVVDACHTRKFPIIAEKVETDEQFQRCRKSVTTIFRDTFSAGHRSSGGSVPANKAVHVQLLQAANHPRFDLYRISRVFRHDVSLSYRLLHSLNSPLFGFQAEIHSIPHALTLLGELARRKWISLVSVASLGDEVADGLLRLHLWRARFCELLGQKITMHREAHERFLLGLPRWTPY